MHRVDVVPVPLERLATLLTPDRAAELARYEGLGREALSGRTVWNVNSTAKGGGVAEMLHTLVAYAAGAEVDVRWVVPGGNPAFFEITKRVHNRLHGVPGDDGELGAEERALYDDALAQHRDELVELVQPRDVVLLHDPQTAGFSAALRERGAHVVWRCHVGLDERNEWTQQAWDFLRPAVEPAHAFIFSRQEFAPEWIPSEWLRIIPPSLDPFSPKNCDLTDDEIDALVHRDGLAVEGGPLPREGRTVLQVSRWDRLKDMSGVLEMFANGLDALPPDTHLVLAGPETSGVADDPEAAEVLDQCRAQWRALPPATQERVHLLSVPMDDMEENARIVNALQRWADVVVQKSLAEGFGLTVTEPMWKGRPVVASAVGGIRDQIEDGVSGILLEDPRDGDALCQALYRLLTDPEGAEAIGATAHVRVRDHYLADRHLIQYVELFAKLLADEPA